MRGGGIWVDNLILLMNKIVRFKGRLPPQRGFSLLELMVAAGLMGFIYYAVSSTLAELAKLRVREFNNFVITQIRQDVVRAISDANSCTETFGGANVSGGAVTSIQFFRPSTGDIIDIVSVNDRFNNDFVELESIELQNFSQSGPVIQGVATGVVQVVLKFNVVRRFGVGGADDLFLSVPMAASVDNSTSTILGCTESGVAIASEICDSLGGTLNPSVSCSNLHIFGSVSSDSSVSAGDLITGTVDALNTSSMSSIMASTVNLHQNYSPPAVAPNSFLNGLQTNASVTTARLTASQRIVGGEVRATQFCRSGVCTNFPSESCASGYMSGLTAQGNVQCASWPARETIVNDVCL